MPCSSDESVCFHFESDFASGEVDTIYADDETPIRVLRIGEAFQSATYLGQRKYELPFEYFRRFYDICATVRNHFDAFRILLLGAGAFSFPKCILTERDDVSVVAVERDPKIIDIASDYFYLKELQDSLSSAGHSTDLEIVIDDAREYLNSTAEQFSVIINDLFDGEIQDLSFTNENGLKTIRDHLVPDGLYLINYVCGESPQDFLDLKKMLDNLKRAFGHAQAIIASDEEFSDFDNYILVASAKGFTFENSVIDL